MPKPMLFAVLLAATAALTACGGGNNNGSGSVTGSKPAQSPTGFLPAVGANVGSGEGYSIVTVTPAATELETLSLINELRTKGTLNGDATVRVDTCMANWQALKPLDYSGVLALAARNHAKYLAFSPVSWITFNPDGHAETADSPYFTGKDTEERINYAAKAAKLAAPAIAKGEIVAIGQETPAIVVKEWLKSNSHCKAISDAEFTHMGSGNVENPQADGEKYGSPAWVVNFGQYY